jgi:hypothetical protein
MEAFIKKYNISPHRCGPFLGRNGTMDGNKFKGRATYARPSEELVVHADLDNARGEMDALRHSHTADRIVEHGVLA